MKRLSLVLLSVLALAACGGGKKKLTIYNWSVYMPAEVLRDFEKRFDCTVIYDEYTSNEEMLAKIQSGATGYDVIFPSGDHVSIMAKLGLLVELDKSRIPNFTNLDPALLARIRFDAGNRFSVPYIMGNAGVAVNTTKVKDFERSFSIYDRADLKGRMTLLDDMREVFGAALKKAGRSVNTESPEELEAARKTVMGWKKNIQKFDSDTFGKAYAAGEFWVVHGYAENIYRELEGNPELEKNTVFFIPKEGGSMYMDNMVILKSAKNVDLAYAFLDYVHEPAVYARIADYFRLPSANLPARALVKRKPVYSIEDLSRSEFKEDLGKNLDLYNRVWQKVRVEN